MKYELDEEYREFPAPAGINRWRTWPASSRRRVPRASGDKPDLSGMVIVCG
ncbi:hypothetical protein SEHO0A_02973 [Salmonella enterica subsp. houtenae str. ATCC BAA-1581]|nr:hypothetical protein SEHO0A_02973 [Salmonella enterica subsp. houtenae str. ATCC BAA-1581]